MTAPLNLCAAPGCHRDVPHTRVLCEPHWFKLPPRIKAHIRGLLTNRDIDSARIAARDFFSGEREDQ